MKHTLLLALLLLINGMPHLMASNDEPNKDDFKITILEESDLNSGIFGSFIQMVKSRTKAQWGALTVASAVIGYGVYKLYQEVTRYAHSADEATEQLPLLTEQDRAVLIDLITAMEEDLEAYASGAGEAKAVQACDLSGLNEPFREEFDTVRSMFRRLYAECDEQDLPADQLEMFYFQVCLFAESLIAQSTAV